MNSDGFITHVARNKDLIIRGGENIYPKEIEVYFFFIIIKLKFCQFETKFNYKRTFYIIMIK
jgi:hypothetical protein